MTTTDLSRRAALTGAGVLCLSCAAGCATYGSGAPPAASTAPAPAAPSAAPAPAAPAPAAPAQGLAATTDIPVGSGTIFADQGVVVTQPTAGQFKAFGIVCPHQGCQVNEVTDGAISCPCHGSTFALTDGAPTAGPATSPLEPRQVTVSGGRVVLA
ncbi:nitrite reductase/ring-hydroxylating ferredoxin subunit [Pseudonocardia sediminis]|uniref:Nitrite reductase/ring-hydroxylating ferredoxin subunit n=1 Tax=Pseudonocardia sediminis TaxID=1397368 RepID=A0A4Q7UU13_PSEST|nr:Rieske (2Fe-2S) protein [Pseudonocardia sediminis]RZT83489.1 nitrite reductase/ring-hydroxylating ferredoxin subunit [Pseudonocardia sediminis]